MAFDTWESYFYPETIDPATKSGVLKNLFGIRDSDVLHDLEYSATGTRQRHVLVGVVTIAKTYDADHLRAIHRYLFQDVYEWAGHYRAVGTSKGPNDFAAPADIDRYLGDAHRLITAANWPSMDRDEFAAAAATVFAYVNTGGSALSREELFRPVASATRGSAPSRGDDSVAFLMLTVWMTATPGSSAPRSSVCVAAGRAVTRGLASARCRCGSTRAGMRLTRGRTGGRYRASYAAGSGWPCWWARTRRASSSSGFVAPLLVSWRGVPGSTTGTPDSWKSTSLAGGLSGVSC